MAERQFKNLDDSAADAMLKLLLASRSFPRTSTFFVDGKPVNLKPEFATVLIDRALGGKNPQFESGEIQKLASPFGGKIKPHPEFPSEGTLHLHPPIREADVFSNEGTINGSTGKPLGADSDIALAKRSGKPIFMTQAFEDQFGPLFKFDPRGARKQEEVLAQFPIDRMKEFLLQKLQEFEASNAKRNPMAAASQQSKKGKP